MCFLKWSSELLLEVLHEVLPEALLEVHLHGHLCLNQILKNVEVFNQKMEMLRKEKVSRCKRKNVWYRHLVTWLSVYSVNHSYSLQYTAYIWNRTKTRKCWKCQPVKKEGFIFYYILIREGFKKRKK